MSVKSRRQLTPAQIWGAPIVLGVLSGVGLVSALFSDGAGDWLAWMTLALPVWVCVQYSLRRE